MMRIKIDKTQDSMDLETFIEKLNGQVNLIKEHKDYYLVMTKVKK